MFIINAVKGKKLILGRIGENEARAVRFDISDIQAEFPGASYSVLNMRHSDPDSYPVNGQYVHIDGNSLYWALQSGDLAEDGLGQCELKATLDGAIVKSIIWTTEICPALDGNGTPPEPWESWQQQVENDANRAEAAAELLEHPGAVAETLPAGSQATASYDEGVFTFGIPKGQDGVDGDSPTASVSKVGDTATITITDKDGTTTAQISDGTDGEDGFSPSASVTKSGKTATISITDKEGTTTAQITDGENGEPGAVPIISIGTVSTLPAGSSATASMDTTDPEHPVLSMGIPKGDPGEVTEAELEAATTELKSVLSSTEEWLGYPSNLFSARLFAITNTTNWTIQSATETSFTILHNTEWTTGGPEAPLLLASGTYVFHANFAGSSLKTFALVSDGTFVQSVGNGEEFTVDGTKTNILRFVPRTQGTFTVTDISVNQKTLTGKIPSLENATENNTTKIADLEEGFNDIATPSIEPMEGVETQASAIRANGEIYYGGSSNYRISRFSVSPGKVYWITATTNWGNALWCFYDSNNSVVEVGTVSASGSDDTTIIDRETTAPFGSAFLVIAYNSTVKNGAVKTQTGYTLGAVWRGKKWVCVGDSLTAENSRTTKHYFDYVADATAITTVNMGYSGSGYARLANENHAFYQRISSCPTDADVVTIFGSFNDLGAGLPLGTENDTGTDTLAGCINTTITNLQTVIPLVNLGIVAPTPWATAVPATSGVDFNYVEMLKTICERRSIPFLDLWRCSNLRPWDADFRELAYSKDGGSGMHPDENGHKLIAPRFKAFLETLLM